jgi:predicted SprT family Zn-dependent metalloprotease
MPSCLKRRGKIVNRGHTVGELLVHLHMQEELRQRIVEQLGARRAAPLSRELEALPLKSSRALTRLGSYVSSGSKALAIRLQFAQEEDQLRQTLLHEVAHFLDHRTRRRPGSYRNPHGSSWREWLEKIGGEPGRGHSTQLEALYRHKLRPVARCEKCGFTLKRLRALDRRKRWSHQPCGGRLIPL